MVACPKCGGTASYSEGQLYCPSCDDRSKPKEPTPPRRLQMNQAPPQSGQKPTNQGGSWYLRADDGQTYGPLPWSQLEQWAKERRVTPASFISSAEDGMWKPATEVFPNLSQVNPVDATVQERKPRGYCRNCGAGVQPQQVACLTCGVAPMNGSQNRRDANMLMFSVSALCFHCRAIECAGLAG